MGLRFRRRVKLFGGLGINFGKKGSSLSIRTKAGSISSKGVSIRTGITGLSFYESFKKKNPRTLKAVPPTTVQKISQKQSIWFYLSVGIGIIGILAELQILTMVMGVLALITYRRKIKIKEL